MESLIVQGTQAITIRPAAVLALMYILPFIASVVIFLLLAWRFWPGLIWVSLLSALMGFYCFVYIRGIRYTITPEMISVRRGIIFKRTTQVPVYRLQDYILTQPFLLRGFGLVNLELKTTDRENPGIWLSGIPASDLVDTLRVYVQQARRRHKISVAH